MNCPEGFIHLFRIISIFLLFQSFQESEYVHFLVLIITFICDSISMVFINLYCIFLFLLIIALVDAIHSLDYFSYFTVFYNLFLTLYYSKERKQKKKKLTIKKYLNALDNCNDVEVECFICLENCEEKKNLKILPCSHFFHSSCLLEWFKKNENTLCPVCRQNIIETDKTLMV